MSEILTVAFEHEMREGALTYHKKTGTGPTRYLNPHFPSIVDIQCGEKAILL